MNDLQIFENPEFGKIRTVTINGEPWFVGKDVAEVLGYEKPRNALANHVDEDDALKQGIMDSLGRTQTMTIINESGLYSLILSSKLPSAKKFKRWVTSEVLPSIRKTGGYGIQMEKLMEIAEQLTQAAVMIVQATSSITQSVNRLIDAVDKLSNEKNSEKQISDNGRMYGQGIENAGYYCTSRCKLETFPKEITDQVDEMLETMVQQQNLNFSMIARFCAVNGYSISSPSVKTYFQKHYANE